MSIASLAGARIPHVAAGDPYFSDVILLWNMRDAIVTAPPLDESIYGKTYSTYGGAPLYKTDVNDGPFAGGHCADHRNATGGGYAPPRAFATDAVWDFNPATGTLTVEGWVKVTAIAGNGASSTIRPMDAAGSGNWIWPAFVYQSGVVRAQGNIIGSQILDVAAGVSPSVWFHYVMQSTGTQTWFAVNGVRLGSYTWGSYNWNNIALQMGGTTTGGTIVGAGAYYGPHRVTLGHNRYGLDTSTTYEVPTDFFPTST